MSFSTCYVSKISREVVTMKGDRLEEEDEDEDDETFMRRITFAEEDRHRFTSTPWRGGFRWFRSENVVPMERWRRKEGSVGNTAGDIRDPAA
jgi:hypothetical protein